jgi:hypothetical protein
MRILVTYITGPAPGHVAQHRPKGAARGFATRVGAESPAENEPAILSGGTGDVLRAASGVKLQARTFDMRARPMVWKQEFVTRGNCRNSSNRLSEKSLPPL